MTLGQIFAIVSGVLLVAFAGWATWPRSALRPDEKQNWRMDRNRTTDNSTAALTSDVIAGGGAGAGGD